MSERRSGILLHPTALPGRFPIGDLGPEAERFLDWLQRAGQKLWQVLPLAPPGHHGSPYSGLSAFAGNPALLSPDLLLADGDLSTDDLAATPGFPSGRARLGPAAEWKERLLRRAWERFQTEANGERWEAFEDYCSADAQVFWLEDWALFATLRAKFAGQPWHRWPRPFADREPSALDEVRREQAGEMAFYCFVQFQVDRQWQRLRQAASERGIELLGDLPIYVAQDSADVWAHRQLFDLDDQGLPRNVAGCPPDYFSDDGQRWGHPLYDWQQMKAQDYRWWRQRLRSNLRWTDRLRLDHFRGFVAYWQIPAADRTARGGSWQPGPGRRLFDAMRDEVGGLPLIAEDLGDLDDAVHQLRHALELPGMRVLQFGFDAESNEHTPHNLTADTVVYTGTHDNDTIRGWYRGADTPTKARFRQYSGARASDVSRAMVRLAYQSPCPLAVIPVQDVLDLASRARFNTPGRATGSWTWRLVEGQLSDAHADELRQLTELFDR